MSPSRRSKTPTTSSCAISLPALPVVFMTRHRLQQFLVVGDVKRCRGFALSPGLDRLRSAHPLTQTAFLAGPRFFGTPFSLHQSNELRHSNVERESDICDARQTAQSCNDLLRINPQSDNECEVFILAAATAKTQHSLSTVAESVIQGPGSMHVLASAMESEAGRD
jgi:hypothetical protein